MVAQILQILTSRIQFNLEMYSTKILMHPQLNILNSSSRQFFRSNTFQEQKILMYLPCHMKGYETLISFCQRSQFRNSLFHVINT